MIEKQIKIIKKSLKSRNSILKSIAKQAVVDGNGDNEDKIYNALIEREEDFTTGFQSEIAIPHARIDSILKPVVYIFRNSIGVNWKSLDKKKTKIAIAILLQSKRENFSIHMDILSNISEHLINNTNKNVFANGTLKESSNC